MQSLLAVLSLIVALMFGSLVASAQTATDTGATATGSVQAPAASEPAPPAQGGGLLDWIRMKQAELNRHLAEAVRRLKSEGSLSAAFFLATIGFLYGVFHAAGPGHGKAVISAYVLANESAVRRAVLLAFLSSAFQAISAILLVGAFALLFKVSGLRINAIGNQLELASYALVALFGLGLLLMQLRALWTPAHAHGDHHHDHHQHDSVGHAHAHDHHGHAHLPGPAELEGNWSWWKAVSLSFAVGLRPCTGALLVLVFAFGQGLFWAGVGATFAMALGTAITVSVLASLALGSRQLATRLAGGAWAGRLETVAGIAGSLLILALGLLFLLAALGDSRPF